MKDNCKQNAVKLIWEVVLTPRSYPKRYKNHPYQNKTKRLISFFAVFFFFLTCAGQAGVKVINEAIADYHKLTCLKFVRRTTQKNYIRFTVGNG